MTDSQKKDLHMQTIMNHRQYVQEMCDMMGIHELGQEHDLSKFTPEEFEQYKYVTGTGSPHEEARRQLGYSPYWSWHYRRNLHHWEAHLDILDDVKIVGDGTYYIHVVPCKMPYEYVIEMFCDFIGAGKAYEKAKWTPETPWNYWVNKCEGKRAMHKDSEYLIKKLLWNLKEMGMNDFIIWYFKSKDWIMAQYEAGTEDY